LGEATAERTTDAQSWRRHYPLTDAQAEKWLGSRYSDAAGLAFGEGCELAFDGSLDVDAMSSAFRAVVDRHEALSMRFDEGGSFQVHEPPSCIELRQHDFRSALDPVDAYATFAAQRAAIPLDPARPPLVEAWLCRLSAGEWRLLLRAHHLVFDGWSLRIVLQDLAAHYNDTVAGTGAIPPVDSWIEYVAAERAVRDGDAGRRSLAYWLERHRDLPEPLRLPTDFPRKLQLAFAAETLELEIPAHLWNRLRAAAREQGVSRFSLLLAGYFLLLHRLSGQDDLVCGIPVAGAARGRGRRVVGDTGSTLPLRIRILEQESLPDFVQRVHLAMREAMDHQDVSLGRIVDALALVREPGRMLLVESILSLNPGIGRLDFHDLDCRLRVLPHLATAWELAWQWRPLPGGMLLELQYHTALYHPSTARAWCQAYVDLLAQMAAGGDVPVAAIGCGDAFATAGFALVNERARDWTAETSLPALLDRAFVDFADRCAAQCGDRGISYAALDQSSRAVASALAARGVAPGQLVGICMARSIDMLVAVLAVLRSGAAYVPLDPAFPAQRLAWMATHARLSLVMASDPQSLPDGVSDGREVLAFDALAADGAAGTWPLPVVDPGSLAYVLYTSGSTGDPKGVRILHRNLANFLQAMREAPGFGRDDAICAATTLSFDIAALELYLPLLCGGRVVVADDDEHRDPEALSRLIERRGCTVLQTTPTLLSLLQEVGRAEVLRPLKLLVGGEALPPALATALLPRCRELWNLYGPTETTVWSSAARLEMDSPTVTLGMPVANTHLYLLDAGQRPVLPGVIGEIWIGGAGVADGYLHAPALSAERFVEDPFAGDGSRMYRSGDLGRIRDGRLYFHGRVDSQIKLRGFRIEPGEIEAVAAAEAGVVECAAVARTAASGDLELVLYAGSGDEPAELGSRLRARVDAALPPYMRPHRIVVLPSLPKTPNGKIDRRALPAPAAGVPAGAVAMAGPRDGLERELCSLWQRLLAREPVGIHENFFELGGHSMLAVRMFAELRRGHGIDLPLSVLIAHPTVSQLAEVLRKAVELDPAPGGEGVPDAHARDGGSSLVVLRSGGGGAPVFLVHAVGGHVLNYLHIARALPPAQPVYGLQSCGLNDDEVPLSSIAAMADRYAREIRAVHPAGPYLLAGGSMGGVVALEVARRLLDAGGRIALLGLFDTHCPGIGQAGGESPWRPHRWPALYRRLDASQRSWLWRRIGFRLWRLPAMRLRQWFGHGRSVPRELRIHLVERTNQLALAAYRPRPYPGRVVLFKATQAGADADPTLGWGGFADCVDVIDVDARHDSVVEQPELVERFRESVAAS